MGGAVSLDASSWSLSVVAATKLTFRSSATTTHDTSVRSGRGGLLLAVQNGPRSGPFVLRMCIAFTSPYPSASPASRSSRATPRPSPPTPPSPLLGSSLSLSPSHASSSPPRPPRALSPLGPSPSPPPPSDRPRAQPPQLPSLAPPALPSQASPPLSPSPPVPCFSTSSPPPPCSLALPPLGTPLGLPSSSPPSPRNDSQRPLRCSSVALALPTAMPYANYSPLCFFASSADG